MTSALAGVFLAIIVAPAGGAIVSDGPSAAVPGAAASPLPGVAYDEIARVIPPGATPPPLGSFDADAAVIAALPPLVLPKAGQINYGAITVLAIIPYVGAWLAKGAAIADVAKQQADLRNQKDAFANGVATRQRTGVLVTFASYRGWSRTELPAAFAIIEKPEQGLTMMLDNERKTYRSARIAGAAETYTVQSGAAAVSQPTLGAAPVVEPLAVAQIGRLLVRGYRTTGSINVPRATFSCAVGEHQVVEVEYVTDVADPRYDAINDSSNAKPLVSACTLGSSTSHREPGRLVLYRIITVDPGTPAEFSVVLERGNIRTIDERDVDLFMPPADFKEAA